MPSLFPAYTPLAVPSQPSNRGAIVYGDSWSFNFDTGEFDLNPDGTVVTLNGLGALNAWIRKALSTQRYAFPIYATYYGSEIERIIGTKKTTASVTADVQKMIKETLLIDDRITDVGNFRHTVVNDQIYTVFDVLSYNDTLANLTNLAVLG